jgi:hypothetical protein
MSSPPHIKGLSVERIEYIMRSGGLRERQRKRVAEAMRTYADETNRFNRERRAGLEAERAELAKIERSLKEIVSVIEDGGYTRMLMDRLRELEARWKRRRNALRAHPSWCPIPIPTLPRFTAVRSNAWPTRSTARRTDMRRPRPFAALSSASLSPPAPSAARSTPRYMANSELSPIGWPATTRMA